MRMLIMIISTISILFISSFKGYAQPKECPVLSDLEQTTIKDKKEVIEE